MAQKISRFVLTGGPCGGKTSAIPYVTQTLEGFGYKVLFIPEAASEVVRSGVRFTDISVVEFQTVVARRILFYEQEATSVASLYPEKDVIILSDRGICDNQAYMPDYQYKKMLAQLELTEEEALHRYDAVFHLVTAACGAEMHYKLEGARHESPHDAREVDIATLKAWLHHPHLHVLDNSEDFDGKLNRLLNKILDELGRG